MAVTAVYAVIKQISRGDGKNTLDAAKTFSNISATPAVFQLSGGKYGVVLVGATFGTLTLQILAGDGTTYVNYAGLSALSANTAGGFDLPAGTYKLVLA